MKPRPRDFPPAPFQGVVQAQDSDMRFPAGLCPVSMRGFMGFDARERKSPAAGRGFRKANERTWKHPCVRRGNVPTDAPSTSQST